MEQQKNAIKDMKRKETKRNWKTIKNTWGKIKKHEEQNITYQTRQTYRGT